jgi:hypothetical protein
MTLKERFIKHSWLKPVYFSNYHGHLEDSGCNNFWMIVETQRSLQAYVYYIYRHFEEIFSTYVGNNI